MTDYVSSAARHWNKGQGDLFEFAIDCSMVVGQPGLGAKKIVEKLFEESQKVVSCDLIERYAKGGELWSAMLQKYPQDAESFRAVLDISYWNNAGKLFHKKLITLAGARQWLDRAIKLKQDADKFRDGLPRENEDDMNAFMDDFEKWMKITEYKLLNAPAFYVDNVSYKKFIRALKVAKRRGEAMRKVAE